jgi:hypothetical protein
MPYAKTSQRAEQRGLRDRMRARGLSHRQITFEFARRYNMRPRAAWRHALGWSLKEAALRINACAAQAGVDPSGTTVAMTGPHLCETENWPGYGPEPTGRRPTPYLLSLLAAAYGCDVADLLDLADYEHTPPADLLVLGKTGDPDVRSAVAAPRRGQAGWRAAAELAERPHPEPLTIPPVALAARGSTTASVDVIAAAANSLAPELAPLAQALLSAPAEDTRSGPIANDVVGIWRLRQAARYRKLAADLPIVLANARAGESDLVPERRVASALTHLYNAASSLAKACGSLELAGIAADRAARTASGTADPLLSGAAAYRLANVLLSAGQLESARSVAVDAADRLRPFLAASRSHTALWGALLATSALAASRGQASAEARELLGESKVAADLLATEQSDLFSIFGPVNWLIHAVNVAADLGDGAEAVRRAGQVAVERLPLSLAERRTFLLLGKARGHELCDDPKAAALALLDAEEAAPEEVRNNPQARSLAARLIAAGPAREDPLRELSTRLGCTRGWSSAGTPL